MQKLNMAVLILAAGTSSRLKQAKQLVRYQAKPLIAHAVEKALRISDEVYVVLGSNEWACKKALAQYRVQYVFNENYQSGLSSSIQCGMQALKEHEYVLIMLADQPLIPDSHFQAMRQKAAVNNEIICSLYHQSHSVPALFPKRYFKSLSALVGDRGAKSVIMKNKHITVTLNNEFSLDIDTIEDLEQLMKSKHLSA